MILHVIISFLPFNIKMLFVVYLKQILNIPAVLLAHAWRRKIWKREEMDEKEVVVVLFSTIWQQHIGKYLGGKRC